MTSMRSWAHLAVQRMPIPASALLPLWIYFAELPIQPAVHWIDFGIYSFSSDATLLAGGPFSSSPSGQLRVKSKTDSVSPPTQSFCSSFPFSHSFIPPLLSSPPLAANFALLSSVKVSPTLSNAAYLPLPADPRDPLIDDKPLPPLPAPAFHPIAHRDILYYLESVFHGSSSFGQQRLLECADCCACSLGHLSLHWKRGGHI